MAKGISKGLQQLINPRAGKAATAIAAGFAAGIAVPRSQVGFDISSGNSPLAGSVFVVGRSASRVAAGPAS